MDGLRALILNVTFVQGHSELESHKLIYSYIEDHVLSDPPSKRTVPPLDVIIYAVRNILYPTFLHSDIPALLSLFSIVEQYRLRAVELARNASVWSNYYKASKEDLKDGLTRDEEKVLNRLMKESRIQAQRHVYRTLILQCCQLDIYHLWHGQYPCIPFRLRDYFYDETRQGASQTLKLFRRDLSDKEQEDLHATGQACLKLFQDVSTWLADRAAAFRARELSEDDALEESELFSYRQDFTSAFPNPVQETALMASIEWYLDKVQTDINAMKIIFPAQSLNNQQHITDN